MKRKISSFLRIGMEGRFHQQVNGCTDGATQHHDKIDNPCSNKRTTLGVNGFWDVVPRLDYYRMSRRVKRPSLAELHEGNPASKDPGSLEGGARAEKPAQQHSGIKLGWIQGVLIPCLLNIWGVMLFLRLSWVVAQAGIIQTSLIIGVSALVCVVTTLSLSAISTNGEVKGGGIYFIISRSLGPEFGASVGVVFAFANAVAASMNTIGFCDSVNELLRNNGLRIFDNAANDTRIIGMLAIVLMILVCAVGMEWESKAQNFLIAIITVAIFDFLIGALIGPQDDLARSYGFEGFSLEVFKGNLAPDYRSSEGTEHTFFSVFAIFFPSVTGIQAGANISGDLRDPAKSIPSGTLLALLISMFSYALFVLVAGATAVRDAPGPLGFGNATASATASASHCLPGVAGSCAWGLHNSYAMMQKMSLSSSLIYAGCFAATLSTALTNLLSVPRLIQALGQDRIYPGLIFFSKGYGKNNEPYRGYVLTFLVAGTFLLIANLNLVAPLISTFYLASYALINFCTFHASLVRPLGWRPTFKYYNTWLSLLGFIGCVAIMFLIDWVASLVTFVIIFALYLIVIYRKPDVNWGSTTQAQTYKTALSIAYRLNSIDEHVKNYAPQILALSGPPHQRPALLHLANLITKSNSLLITGEVYPNRLSYRVRSARLSSGYAWLARHRIKSFYHVVEELGLEKGASAMMQAAGVGKLAPNVVLMGYKTHWQSCQRHELQEYFNVLHNAFDHRLAVAILRVAEGLDRSSAPLAATGGSTSVGPEELAGSALGTTTQICSGYELAAGTTLMHADSDLSMSGGGAGPAPNYAQGISRVQSVPAMGTHYVPQESFSSSARETPATATGSPVIAANHHHINKYKKRNYIDKLIINRQSGLADLAETITVFQRKHKNGTIDVWWLYDDGGLTILLPYIISTRANWEHCKMRIFALANHKQDIAAQEKEMSEIMAKFRIKYTSLKMVDDISVKPRRETQAFFDRIVDEFRQHSSSELTASNLQETMLTDGELASLRDKTFRQLRLRELLLENSSQSTLLVMSLPMPRKGAVSAALYMAWLEALTRDMPPTLLIRGNHSSVLTFYS